MTETRNVAAVPQRRHGANIGQPLTRRDGLLKVTGQARYAADDHSPGMLHAVLAVSSIARGRVIFLDVAAAKAHPGVVEVMTPTNRPPLALDPDAKLDPFMFRLDVLQNDRVRYAGQPIAVVIAETLEAATEAATLLSPRYEAEQARIGLDGNDTFIPRLASARRPRCVTAMSTPGWPQRNTGSRRSMRPQPSTIMLWNRTPSWPPGMVSASRWTRRARVWPGRKRGLPGCSESRRRTSSSAARFWVVGLAPRG